MSAWITQRIEDGLATLTLNRPEVHNAFDDAMMGELQRAVEEAGRRDDVRVIVIAGEGKSFCAGADIHWMKRMVDYTMEENVADAMVLSNMLRAIRESQRPVIARIHGATFGGGVGLVAACDVAVAVATATFCLSEVKLGIVPAVISPFVMEKIGPGQMRRYALTAERFDAAEARRVGLIHEVFPSVGEMDGWLDKTCAILKSSGPTAIFLAKRILTEVAGVDWNQVQNETAQCIAEARVSPEGQEGLKAFLDKRKPAWQTGP